MSCNSSRHEGAKYALVVFTLVNGLNWADRYVLAAVKELIKKDLNLTDMETSLPATGLTVLYMIFCFLFGWLSDQQIADRRIVLSAAIIFWSAATALAGLSQNVVQLVLIRSLVGVGEAAYSTIVPVMIADFFPLEDRTVAYGVYYLAVPVGGALGYGVGAIVGTAVSWRIAFLVCGLPGILAAVMILRCQNPPIGYNDTLPEYSESTSSHPSESSNPLHASDQRDTNHSLSSSRNLPPLTDSSIRNKLSTNSFYKLLNNITIILRNRHYSIALAGMTSATFAMSGLADWMSTYIVRYEGSSIAEAGLLLSAITIVGGIGGNILGAKVTVSCNSIVKSASYLIPALFAFPAALCFLILINTSDQKGLVYTVGFLGSIFAYTYLAPSTTLLNNVVSPHIRSTAGALSSFFTIILGAALAPPFIGWISDETHSLRNGMQLCWMAQILTGVIWLYGYIALPALPITSHSEGKSATATHSTLTYSEILCCDFKYYWYSYTTSLLRVPPKEKLSGRLSDACDLKDES